MSHLGDRISALVDGELDHDARDRALAHIASCPRCRAAVDEERWLKSRLHRLPATEPSATLLSALFAAPRVPAQRQLEPVRDAERGPRVTLVLAGAGSVSAAMLTLAYLLGGSDAPTPVAPPVSPPVGQFSAEFAGTTEGLPFSDPAVGVYPVAVQSTGPSAGPR